MTSSEPGRLAAQGTQLVVRVVPDLTGLDKQFDYVVPTELRDVVSVGSIVRVPLHGRRVAGWVVAMQPPEGPVPVERLLPVAAWSGHGPGAELVDVARWAAHRWAANRLRPLLVAASPPVRVRSIPAAAHGPAHPAPTDAAADALLAHGGGVLRVAPTADELPVVLAACGVGPALVVVPSVDRARALGARLRDAGRTVAVMPEGWAAAAGGVDVVIGARAAAWAPCRDLAAVVVVDEHDEALQEERAPTWHARDVVRERARRAGVPVLLVSPAPTVVALATNREVRRPTIVDERASWPRVDVVDQSSAEPWRRSLLSSELIAELRDTTRRVVCVLNATGRARLLACRACRSLVRCERCEAAVGQDDAGVLVCRRCGTTRPVVCQVCGATRLSLLRHGVGRLADDVAAAAGRPVAIAAGDPRTGAAGAVDRADPAHQDGASGAGIVVGTEAALHRVRAADVVAFVDLDAELLAPRYRAAEQAMALIVRAARLVGPRAGGGRVLLQTSSPSNEVVQAARHADPGRLATVELERRRMLGFPPFGALAWMGGAGAPEMAAELRTRDGLQVGGTPDDGYLLRAASWRSLADAIAAVPRPARSRVRIEVDPQRR